MESHFLKKSGYEVYDSLITEGASVAFPVSIAEA